jgi:threonine synthase
MTTLGDNVDAVAVRGTFDDCQRLVKAAFAHEEISRSHGLTSANSINVARLLPQAIYFLEATRHIPEPIHFVVPSGNLGNLCAGLIAAHGGMPHAGFTAAFNRNHGVADFLRGGPFQAKASVPTVSNAMDVGDPSNLERIRWLYGNDNDAIRRDVRGAWVSDEETVRTIAEVHARTGYVMDPHTAVGYAAASRQDAGSDPIVTLATAHPAKFPEVVQRAIGAPVQTPFAMLRAGEKNEVISMIRPTLEELWDLLDRRHP